MEYILLIIEFFWLKGIKAIFWTCFIPVLISVLIFCKSDNSIYTTNASAFHSNIISVLGILIGFTISTFTLLLTVNNKNIEAAKLEFLEKKLFSKKISLFDSVIVGLAYIILVQGVLLIANFIYPVFISITTLQGKAFFSVNISLMIHIILVLMRNVLDFYFILTKEK